MIFYYPIILLLALLCGGCRDHSTSGSPAGSDKSSQTAQSPASATSVNTVTPEYRSHELVLETNGKVQFNEERLLRINAPLTGRVADIFARPGDVVDAGHPLFALDSPDLGSAKSDYAKAISDLERSEKARALTRDLFEVKAVAEKELRDADNDYSKAVAEKERAASRLRALGIPEAQLKDVANRADAATRMIVRAPRGGVIVERNIAAGQVVSFGQSDTPLNLFVIADLSTMWVLGDIYEPDVPKVRLGQSVKVTLPCCPTERYEGRISYISDSVDPQTRTVKIRAVVPNRGRMLKAEMFVKVSIQMGSSAVLVVPQSAVHVEEGQAFVLLDKGNGGYERRAVKVGNDLDDVIEILAGISPQDRIVASGSILLKKTAR